MDLDTFNGNFPSFEKEYYNMQINQDENLVKKTKFNKKYPQVGYFRLMRQIWNKTSDDGCIHYRDILTGNVYSWNFIKNDWTNHSKNYQMSLGNMF